VVVVLPYFMIEDEDKLGNVFNVIFPFIEGTIVGVLYCCGTEMVGNSEIVPKGCL
jgi:hypothetical protein